MRTQQLGQGVQVEPEVDAVDDFPAFMVKLGRAELRRLHLLALLSDKKRPRPAAVLARIIRAGLRGGQS